MQKFRNQILFLFILALFFFVTLNLSGVFAAEAPYKIGVNMEFTGPYANATKTLRMAMELEVDRINKMGGIDVHPMELVFEDTMFDMAKVSSNLLKFVRDKEILAVVGPFEDNFQTTSRSIAEREGIVNIIIAPANKTVRALNQRWSFNASQSELIVTQRLVELCKGREYKKILVFPGNWPLALGLADSFKELGEKDGLTVIVSKETHKPSDIDMTPQLIKMRPIIDKEGIDAIYLSTGGPSGPIACKNIRTLGIKTPILGTHAFGFGFVLGIGGEAMEGVEFPAGKSVVPYQLDEDDPVRPIIVDFHERMKARYGIGADQIAGHAYDIVWLLHNALENCKGKVTRDRLRDKLEKTKKFNGCTGIFTFSKKDHEGLNKSDLVFIRVEGGKFKRVKFPGI
jgi:branched-chain amino acid transport system substrate-binding protein